MVGMFVACLGLLTLGDVGQNPEPSFKGKPLSFWLQQYDTTITSIEPKKVTLNKQAVIAVRSIGTNAIPTLLKMVAKGSFWPSGRPKVNVEGIDGFVILGASASNAVPALVKIFKDKNSLSSQASAAWALDGIGTGATAAVPALLDATTNMDSNIRPLAFTVLAKIPTSYKQVIPIATQALDDTNVLVKLTAMRFLRSCGSEAKGAVSALVELSTNTNSGLRDAACATLGKIHSFPDIAVPALVARLADPDPLIREQAAWALGNFGTLAKKAVPALTRLRNDKNTQVRSAAEKALRKISHETN